MDVAKQVYVEKLTKDALPQFYFRTPKQVAYPKTGFCFYCVRKTNYKGF